MNPVERFEAWLWTGPAGRVAGFFAELAAAARRELARRLRDRR